MNSEITLTNYPTSATSKGKIYLLYKRSDPCNATLLEDGVPRYFISTSRDGISKVKISDAARKPVVEVERRSIAKDIFKFANRYDGKAVKVANVLRKAPSTSEGHKSMALDTLSGRYYWRKTRGRRHGKLYAESSSAPVAWTECVSGPATTWALIIDPQIEDILDYILASFFYYVCFEMDSNDAWESVDSRVAYLSMK